MFANLDMVLLSRAGQQKYDDCALGIEVRTDDAQVAARIVDNVLQLRHRTHKPLPVASGPRMRWPPGDADVVSKS